MTFSFFGTVYLEKPRFKLPLGKQTKPTMSKSNQPSYQTAFSFFVILFFMWAFLTEMNGVLVPFVKKVFDFGYTQSSLVQSCFFIAFA